MGERRWFLPLCLLTVILALVLAGALMLLLKGSSVDAVKSAIDAYKSELTGMRLVVIVSIAYSWPKVLQFANRSGRISKERTTELKQLRWRIVGWLLLIELLLGQDLVWRLLQTLDWSSV